MSNKRRGHRRACLVVSLAWSLLFLSIALGGAEVVAPAASSGSHNHDCHSLRPRLAIHKHLLPTAQLDSRDRRVTVIVEWQLDIALPDEGGKWDCRYVVRVTDSVPGLPLRVPNELAHLFSTTHNESYVHREYPVSFNKDASSPVSLSPLNDSLQFALPSPQLTLLAAHADGTEARVIDSAVPASPTVLTLSLYYTPASVSLYDALGLSVACVTVILVCHFLTAGRLDKAVRAREECYLEKWTNLANMLKRVKQKKAEATHVADQSPTVTTAPAPSAAQSVVDNRYGSATPALPDDSSPSTASSSAPAPYRFKAKDTRKRFTRPPAGGGSMDF